MFKQRKRKQKIKALKEEIIQLEMEVTSLLEDLNSYRLDSIYKAEGLAEVSSSIDTGYAPSALDFMTPDDLTPSAKMEYYNYLEEIEGIKEEISDLLAY